MVREEFTEIPAALADYLANIIREGIYQGVFRPVDPDRTAEFLTATLEGIDLQETTRTDEPGAMLRDELQNELLVDDTSF